MKSKAQVNGHPLHPMLIAFLVAFFTGTVAFDLLHAVTGVTGFEQTSLYLLLLGLVGGLVATIPGAIDYYKVVPPESSAKKRATSHALLNISMLTLFAVSFVLRVQDHFSYTLILILEIAGFAAMATAGWMGATLVYRNHIGVYNRYANAGNWQEATYHFNGKELAVATTGELKLSQMKLLHINNKRIVLAKTETGYTAFDDKCSHKGGSLAGGTMICGTVHCPWHGSQFDACKGNVVAGPAKQPITIYKVMEKEGTVYLQPENI